MRSSCDYKVVLRRQLEVQELVMRQLPASKDMNMEVEKATALEAITRQEPAKTHQTEDFIRAVVNCRVHELANGTIVELCV
jgi:hypothetical protein